MDTKTPDNNFMAGSNLTKDGQAWLTTVCDPFHDNEHTCGGYPDGRVSHSYVLVQKESTDLKAPTNGTWDCHISILPEMFHYSNSHGEISTVSGMYGVVDQVGEMKFHIPDVDTKNVPDLGNVVACSIPSGGATWNPLNETEHKTVNREWQALPSSNAALQEGCARVVAIAFEVHNTSSPLNRGGSVTTYRMPSGNTTEMHHMIDDAKVPTFDADDLHYESFMPPPYVTVAQRIPNARTWEAKDGCYVIGTFTYDDNDIIAPRFGRRTFYYNQNDADNPAIVFNLADKIYKSEFCMEPIDIAGAYFTNLPSETTLRLNVVRYLEVSPTPSSQTISAAVKAPAYDSVALDMYFKLKNTFPSGVPVSENSAGDWWRKVVSGLKKIAPTVSGFVDKHFLGDKGYLTGVTKALGLERAYYTVPSNAVLTTSRGRNGGGRGKGRRGGRKGPKKFVPYSWANPPPQPKGPPPRRERSRRVF